jgi:Right handed beta helix region
MNVVSRASCILTALLSAVLATAAHAAVVTVTTLADSGAGSLRDAVGAANAGDVIQFSAGLSGAIVFHAPLQLSKDVSIVGNGAVALDGNDAVQVLKIQNGTQVTLDSLTIQHGYDAFGGGIYNEGRLTLKHCTIRDNHATFGGGLLVESAPGSSYALLDSFVIDNEAVLSGGGIYDNAQADSSIARSEIAGNLTGDSGGGLVFFSAHALAIDHSTISGNYGAGTGVTAGGGIAVFGSGRTDISYSTVAANKTYLGGGIYVYSTGASTMNLTATLVAGNSAIADGGGIFVRRGTLNAFNTTIAENIAGLGSGGGLGVQVTGSDTASVVLASSTIAFNLATSNAGGIYVGSGSLSLQDTLVGSNASTANPDMKGAFTSLGSNLVQQRGASSGYIASDLPDGSDPKLNVLGFNGGPTDTLSLQPGSAASNAIPAANCTNILLDQRGYRRLWGACDIGAFDAEAIGDTIFAYGFE